MVLKSEPGRNRAPRNDTSQTTHKKHQELLKTKRQAEALLSLTAPMCENHEHKPSPHIHQSLTQGESVSILYYVTYFLSLCPFSSAMCEETSSFTAVCYLFGKSFLPLSSEKKGTWGRETGQRTVFEDRSSFHTHRWDSCSVFGRVSTTFPVFFKPITALFPRASWERKKPTSYWITYYVSNCHRFSSCMKKRVNYRSPPDDWKILTL